MSGADYPPLDSSCIRILPVPLTRPSSLSAFEPGTSLELPSPGSFMLVLELVNQSTGSFPDPRVQIACRFQELYVHLYAKFCTCI
jgi:hypothetical protein